MSMTGKTSSMFVVEDVMDNERAAFYLLADLRESGWMVAVHNDYRVVDELMTFWLLTHPSGIFVKGEGATDYEALTQCANAARQIFRPSP